MRCQVTARWWQDLPFNRGDHIAHANGTAMEMNQILSKNHPSVRFAIGGQGFERLITTFGGRLIGRGDGAADARLGGGKINGADA